MRHIRVVSLGLAIVAIVVTLSAIASGASASTQASGPLTRYAKVRKVCLAPAARDAACFALALVPAAAGAAGARSYQLGAGAVSRGPAGGLTPADLASAYGYSPSVGGTGQTVAIVDAYDDPNIESDLATFDGNYGLVPCTTANGCFKKVGQTGSATSLPPPDTAGWSVEMSLDVETVHGVCPNCKILLVEANSARIADLAASVNEAVSLGADEVSNSYGTPEAGMGAAEQAAYDHPGVVIAASAGDAGFLDWDYVFEYDELFEMPNAPASLPSVVAVGGTSLKLKANGTRSNESV
jgi:subtilase family serine protease